jgi:hypothetical protein
MKEHITTPFGEQLFGQLELSAMTEVDPDGFYKCLMSLDFMHDPPKIIKEYVPEEHKTKKRKPEEKESQEIEIEEIQNTVQKKCCAVL